MVGSPVPLYVHHTNHSSGSGSSGIELHGPAALVVALLMVAFVGFLFVGTIHSMVKAVGTARSAVQSGDWTKIAELSGRGIGVLREQDSPEASDRRATVAALAASRGWAYTARNDDFIKRWDQFVPKRHGIYVPHPFLGANVGAVRRCENIVVGTHHGHPFVAFDLMCCLSLDPEVKFGPMLTQKPKLRWRKGGEPEPPSVSCYSVVSLYAGATMPSVVVTPENAAARKVGALLNRDLLLESDDFNRRFSVQAQNPRFASDLLHPRMMQMLLAEQVPLGRWETLGPDLVSIEEDTPFTGETLDQRLGMLDRVLHEVPDHVWRTLIGASPGAPVHSGGPPRTGLPVRPPG